MPPDIKMRRETGVLLKSKQPVPAARRGSSPEVEACIERFKKFAPGDSFFVAGAKRIDLEFLRMPFVAAGLGVVFREVLVDEVHKVAGVRVWRQIGPFDMPKKDEEDEL